MTAHTQPFHTAPNAGMSVARGGSVGGRGATQARYQQRLSGEFRPVAVAGTNGHSPLPVPSAAAGRLHSASVTGSRPGAFDGPRSPSNTKNTSHVPCKFFRQGACQAGKACPFSHSTEPAADQPACKYFQKGNCKFGAKCALAHILPDGRRVNKPSFGIGGGNNFSQGARMNAIHGQDFSQQGSLLSIQAHMSHPHTSYPYQAQEEYLHGQRLSRPPHEGIPSIDATFTSYPNSTYGSPGADSQPLSPPQKNISLLEAPLPASFDSQGISHMARYGPIAASVPSRFGLESPPPHTNHGRREAESSALRTLHTSAFGDEARIVPNGMVSTSPSNSGMSDLAQRRSMNLERPARTGALPSSMGARPPGSGEDWDESFAFEEDLVPTALHDLLTPQEKMRRFSRSNYDEETLANLSQIQTQGSNKRASFSGLVTPLDASSKASSPNYGSPGTSAPSRFGPLFNRGKNVNQPENLDAYQASAFGHVGSPLRNLTLHSDSSPPAHLSTQTRNFSDGTSMVSSPTRTSSMSMLSQQLQRTRLSSRAAAAESGAPLQHPGVTRVASAGNVGSGLPPTVRVDRVAGNRDRITEEQEQEQVGLFDMEEEEGMERRSKRYSGSWNWGMGGRGSPLGAIGSRLSGGSGIGSIGEAGNGGASAGASGAAGGTL